MEVRPRIQGPKAYTLKKPNELYSSTWHVTARFQVQVKEHVFVKVVRLRHGVGPVKHFTEDEVTRMFNPVEGN